MSDGLKLVIVAVIVALAGIVVSGVMFLRW